MRETKVHDLHDLPITSEALAHHRLAGDEDIADREIVVADAMVVNVGRGVAGLEKEGDARGDVFLVLVTVEDDVGGIAHQLHHQEGRTTGGVCVQHRRDVGMMELREHFALSL